MYMYTPGHCRVISTGVYLPEQRVTSKELMEEINIERFGFSTDWMDKTMGIHERRIAPIEMRPSELAIESAVQALERAQLDPTKIDLLIFAGIDRDYAEPGTSHVVQDAIGAKNAICFDVTNACHSFMNGIHLTDALIATGQARRALIVTGEKPSKALFNAMEKIKRSSDPKDFENMIGGLSVGDAGAAMVIGPKLGPDSGFMGFMLQSQGQHFGECKLGIAAEYGYMEMRNIVRNFVNLHADMYPKSMAKFGWEIEDIAQFVHHQVGIRPFRRHAAYSSVPIDLMSETVSQLGNITSATIPVNLQYLSDERKIKTGDKIFIAGIGSGLSISQTGLIWDSVEYCA